MAVVFPTDQVARVEGPQLDYEFRYVWKMVPPPAGADYAYGKVQQRRQVETFTVTWLCTKLAGDIYDAGTPKWTGAPAGFERVQAVLEVQNARTRPLLCVYRETWQTIPPGDDSDWEDLV